MWVPLVVAVLGLTGTAVGTIGGVLIAQRRSDRRETENWVRESERERARWLREDEARTFEQRRVAYVEFFESLREMQRIAYNHGFGLEAYGGGQFEDGTELPEGWQTQTFRRLQHLQIYAMQRVADLASEAYSATWRWGHAARYGVLDDRFHADEEQSDVAEMAILDAIREDLRVPET